MKKISAFLLLIFMLIPLSLWGGGTFPVAKVAAEEISTSSLRYFELISPVSVCRDENAIYIAENYTDEKGEKQNFLIIYKEDTYEKIEVPGGNVRHIEKCGNFLLILSGTNLYYMNVTTKELKLLTYTHNEITKSFENVKSFAVCGNSFSVNIEKSDEEHNRSVVLFDVTDEENFIFELSKEGKPNSNSDVLALSDETKPGIYYFDNSTKKLSKLVFEGNVQENYINISLGENFIDQLFYYKKTDSEGNNKGMLFYKVNDNILKVGVNPAESTPEVVLNLSENGISGSGDFFIKDDKMLICDNKNNKVVEYDLAQNKFTEFEISFTKIAIPQDFELALNQNPQFVTIPATTKLYNVDYEQSIKNNYFTFKNYYTQENTAQYVVIAEISNLYYLIAGDSIALVMKTQFTPEPVVISPKAEQAFFTSKANTYLLPILKNEFINGEVAKHKKVDVIANLKFRDMDFCIVKDGENIAYIPSVFLIDSIYEEPERDKYKTAVTYNRTCTVYKDSALSERLEELPAYTDVIITDETDNAYLITYGDNKKGYIEKSMITKRGYHTDKIVAVVILCSIAVLATAIYLELNYLYSKHSLKKTVKVRKKH